MVYSDIHNFGDNLNKLLFEKVFGVQFNYRTNYWQADYIAIGSVLGRCCSLDYEHKVQSIYRNVIGILTGGIKLSKITVLGSGFQDWWFEGKKIKYLRKMDFKIVRGKWTEHYLRKNNMIKGDVVLGDLGLLVPYMIKGEEKKYTLGIIPHFTDLSSPVIFEIYRKHEPDSILINVQDSVEKVIREISECETIVSTSLHGLIVADSYGIPNLWVENRLKYGILGRYKYYDYYSIYGTEKMEPIDLLEVRDKNILGRVSKEYKIRRDEVRSKQEELYEYCVKYFEKVKRDGLRP
ncbi:hypothetical protein Holit_03146 [Hollandina sp. SP2]